MPKGRSQPFGGAEVGKEVDVKDSYGHWYTCKVLEIDDPDAPTAIYVSWLGWAQKYNVWVHDRRRVRPARGVDECAMELAKKLNKSTAGATVIDGEVFWDIKDVLKVRVTNGRKMYYVHWDNWAGREGEYSWLRLGRISALRHLSSVPR